MRVTQVIAIVGNARLSASISQPLPINHYTPAKVHPLKKSIFTAVSLTVIMAGALASCVRAADTQKAPSPHAPAPVAGTQPPLSAERTVAITITAKVEAIDQAKREVTLKGPLGNVVSFVVDSRVERLTEINFGDDVRAAKSAHRPTKRSSIPSLS